MTPMAATTTTTTSIGLAVLVIGLLLIVLRRPIAAWAAAFYKKIGLEVSEEKYSRQFTIIGFILLILGFLVATGLINAI